MNADSAQNMEMIVDNAENIKMIVDNAKNMKVIADNADMLPFSFVLFLFWAPLKQNNSQYIYLTECWFCSQCKCYLNR